MDSRFCAYGEMAKCKECNHILYAKCETYKKYHAMHMISALKPFDFKWDKTQTLFETNDVIWCSGTDRSKVAKVKSNAVNWALKTNNVIERVTTDMVLNRVLNPNREDPIITKYKGVFLHLSRRQTRNKDAEVIQTIESFINEALDMGVKVFACTRYPLTDSSWLEIKR